MLDDLPQTLRLGGRWLLLGAWLATALPVMAAERALVGGDPNYPPFHYLDEDGQAAGRDVQLVRAIARDQDLQVEFSLVEWGRTLSLLERGSVDMVPMFITEDRARRFDFSQPFARRHHQVFGRRKAGRIDGVEDLAGRRVAVQFAGMAWEWLSNQNAGVDIQPINIEDSAVLAVVRGEADFALVPSDIGERAIAVHGLEDIVALSPPMLERDYAFGVSRGRPALREKINAGIDNLRASGELDRIMTEDIPARVPTERHQRPIPFSGRSSVSWWIAGLILLGLLFWLGLRWSRTPPE
ncbi:MAG TPA: transporter substrate-binding domain-containing protein [Arenimonas sp.]|uniref:transporter substrate-binding domain-containing protein n=1 Tax=Arenimonas sp. TaxID=1872635 RepID=UPI002D809740|nr:transporter substrate-binding domain-containing protein [Arenimonas sp.]HEU0152588.1 transporter substrate-binding domain-containing protein [Arenimonas sp.]